jgi:hypothetical protein
MQFQNKPFVHPTQESHAFVGDLVERALAIVGASPTVKIQILIGTQATELDRLITRCGRETGREITRAAINRVFEIE